MREYRVSVLEVKDGSVDTDGHHAETKSDPIFSLFVSCSHNRTQEGVSRVYLLIKYSDTPNDHL